jgi:hypothetical protein
MKTSPAIRVNAILEKAAKTNEKSNVLVAFAGILELAPPEGYSAMAAAMVALNEFREEIHRVDLSLKETDTPKDLRSAAITAALNLTSPYHLGQPWVQHRDQQLKPEVVGSWKWIAHTTPAVEDEVTEEALKDLELELGGLTEAASADGVPDDLRAFIIGQAEKIRKALRRYRVEGIEPLKDAVSTGIGDFILAKPMLTAVDEKNPAAKNALAKYRETFGKVAGFAKDVTAVAFAYRLVAKVVPALQHHAQDVIARLKDIL